MKAFTIDIENNITVHGSRKAAKETGASVFASEEQLAELIGTDNKRLISIWNSLTGVAPVKKFKDSKTGVTRIWKQIQSLGEVATAKQEASAPEPAVAEVAQAPAVAEPAARIEDCGTAAPAIAESTEPVADAGAQAPDVAPEAKQSKKRTTRAKKAPTPNHGTEAAKSDGPREGSKTAQVVTMLKREKGATISEIMNTMGWQKHTVRGFMAGAMEKAGYTVDSFKPEGGERTYRIK